MSLYGSELQRVLKSIVYAMRVSHHQAYGCPFYGYMGTLDPADPTEAHAHDPGLGSDTETSPPVREFIVVLVLVLEKRRNIVCFFP